MHNTDYVENIKELLKVQNYKDADELILNHCVELTESESNDNGWGVAPWYYERLAIIYRKQKRYSEEVIILERYEKQKKAGGVKPGKLKERLAKAKERINAKSKM